MLVTYLLSVGLALVAGAAPDEASTAQPPARTLLLVQPLYPGQEMVAQRAEQSIGSLLPQEMRAGQIIGSEALAAWMEGRRVRTGCLLDKRECREPLEAWMKALGLESVVLVKGGQDGSGFRFRAVRVRTAGERLEGEATDPHFDKALMGALVKVYSLAATVQVVSTPPGATLFVDGVKLGTTPLSTQVLPGEHSFRFELASYEPLEVSQTVVALAQAKVEQMLQLMKGRLVVVATPGGTRILVDGQDMGQDQVDLHLQPGPHALRLEQEGYRPFETKITLSSVETYRLERNLEPVAPKSEPLAPKQEPVAEKPESVAPKQEPVTPAPEPIAPKQESVAPKSEPVAPKSEPVAPAPKPVAPTPEPVPAGPRSEPAAEKRQLSAQAPALPVQPMPPPSGPITPAAGVPNQVEAEPRDNFFEVTVQGVDLRGQQMVASPMAGTSRFSGVGSASVVQPQALQMRGFSFDLGARKKHISWAILGGSLSWSETPWEMELQVPQEWRDNPPPAMQELQQAGPPRFRATVIALRLLNPQVHFTLWNRFTPFLQVGLEGRLVRLDGVDEAFKTLFPEGLMGVDVHVNGRAGLRARLFGEVYATVAYQMSHPLRGHISGTKELNGGLGYVF